MKSFNRIFLYVQYLIASIIISLSLVISGALFVASIYYINVGFSGGENLANSVYVLLVACGFAILGAVVFSISLPTFIWLKRTILHIWSSYDEGKSFYRQLNFYFGVLMILAIMIAFVAYMGTFNIGS